MKWYKTSLQILLAVAMIVIGAKHFTNPEPREKCLLAPNETIIRKNAIAPIQSQPRRILDLGCGTGSTTLMLNQAFPQAQVIGLDLSPYMLVMADRN